MFSNKSHIDPESLTWNPLDGEISSKLDKRRYVSLSADQASNVTEPQDSTDTPGRVPLPSTEDLSSPNEEKMSLFDIAMPGVLTLKDLEREVDLDHWGLLVHGQLVEMEVSFRHAHPFICWESHSLDFTHARGLFL